MSEPVITSLANGGRRKTKILVIFGVIVVSLLTYVGGVIVLPLSVLTSYKNNNCTSTIALYGFYVKIYPGFIGDVVEGRLWEHLQNRSHGHPALFGALKKLRKYSDYFESQSPVSKGSGLFFYGAVDLARPEVVRHAKRLKERYAPPKSAKVLLLLPQTRTKPFHKSREHSRVIRAVERKLGQRKSLIHICTYSAPFGVVPIEIDEVYPLSQHEVALPLDNETIRYVAEQVQSYVVRSRLRKVILLNDAETWSKEIESAVRRARRKGSFALTVLNPETLALAASIRREAARDAAEGSGPGSVLDDDLPSSRRQPGRSRCPEAGTPPARCARAPARDGRRT